MSDITNIAIVPCPKISFSPLIDLLTSDIDLALALISITTCFFNRIWKWIPLCSILTYRVHYFVPMRGLTMWITKVAFLECHLLVHL